MKPDEQASVTHLPETVIIESDYFRMDGGDFAFKMFVMYGKKWLTILFGCGIAAIVLSFIFDIRILIIGMALIFIVIPGVAAWLYYNYGLRKECFVNIFTHKLALTANGIKCEVQFPPYKRENIKSGDIDEKNEVYSENEETDIGQESRNYFFPYTMMSAYHIYPKGIVIPLLNDAKGFLWVPKNVWGESGDGFTQFIDNLRIDTKIKKEV